MKLKIIIDENKLRVVSKSVEEMTDDIKKLIKDMKETVLAHSAIGLASNQIGKNIQLFVFLNKDLKLITCINPEILHENKSCNFLSEECLSEPKIKVNICRSRKIKVKFKDENFEDQELELTTPHSNIWLHEESHLRGKLIIDER